MDAEFSKSETKRLFYVAATRAMDHLALIGKVYKSSTASSSWLAGFTKFKNEEDHVAKDIIRFTEDMQIKCEETEIPPDDSEDTENSPDGTEDTENPPDRTEDTADHKELAESGSNKTDSKPLQKDEPKIDARMLAPLPRGGFLSLNVTTYSKLWAELKNAGDAADISTILRKLRLDEAPTNGDGEPRAVLFGPRGKLKANERGNLFHALMESTDCAFDLARYKKDLEIKAQELHLSPTAVELDFIAQKAMEFQESDIGRLLRNSIEKNLPVFREWPVWLRLDQDEFGNGPIILNGAIDLFFVDSKSVGHVVDFKFTFEKSEPRYERQVELYALAVKESGFVDKVETMLYYPKL
jgi:ATP-dependent exoDNAse (exonuclease V) beta subunit